MPEFDKPERMQALEPGSELDELIRASIALVLRSSSGGVLLAASVSELT